MPLTGAELSFAAPYLIGWVVVAAGRTSGHLPCYLDRRGFIPPLYAYEPSLQIALGGAIDILPQTVEGKQGFSAGVLEMVHCLRRKYLARQISNSCNICWVVSGKILWRAQQVAPCSSHRRCCASHRQASASIAPLLSGPVGSSVHCFPLSRYHDTTAQCICPIRKARVPT